METLNKERKTKIYKIESKIRSFKAEKLDVGDLEDYRSKLEVISTLNEEVYVISKEIIDTYPDADSEQIKKDLKNIEVEVDNHETSI